MERKAIERDKSLEIIPQFEPNKTYSSAETSIIYEVYKLDNTKIYL